MRIEDLLLQNRNNENIAIEYRDNSISFSDWNKEAEKIGEIITNVTKKVENIIIYIPNSIFYAIAYFAILYKKGVVVPIYYGSSEYEIENTLRFCESDIVITISREKDKIISMLQNYEYTVTIICIDEISVFKIGGRYGEIEKTHFFRNSGNEDDVAIMLHTSGSVSQPKRVMLTHTNIVSNIISNIQSLDLQQNDIGLIALPMVFGYCNTAQFLTHLYLGAKIIIMDGIFFPKTFFELVEKKKITNFTAVPTMLLMMLDYRYSNQYVLDSLRFICYGGGTVSVKQINKIMSKFPTIDFIQTYGQTECSPRVTALLPPNVINKIGSVGKAIPGVEIKIYSNCAFDINNIPYAVGEILVKGNNVMKGYYKNEQATKNIKEGDWLHTGDIGYMDEMGYLYLVGRIKNIIISGGINIYPEEVECIIREIEGIRDVCVKGIMDEKLGELVAADIVLSNKEINEKDIIAYCKNKLSRYKVPKKINFVDQILVTYNGKIKRENIK